MRTRKWVPFLLILSKVVLDQELEPFWIKDRILLTVGKSKQDLIKKVHPIVTLRQRMPYKRKEEYFVYFEDNAGVIVNSKFVLAKSTLLLPTSNSKYFTTKMAWLIGINNTYIKQDSYLPSHLSGEVFWVWCWQE